LPNAIKYSTSAQTLALKKGNFYIGTGDVGKGPTSTTDYWNGITPPSGGYTIYLNKSSGGPSIYTAANDSQLISLSNTIAGQTFATAAAALAWFATQTDKMVFNSDYPSIVTDGLVLNLDAGFTPSYPTTGSTWYDVSSGGINGTLINGPTFNSANNGSIVFDGVDDYVTGSLSNFNVGCISMWINPSTLINSGTSFQSLIVLKYTGVFNSEWYASLGSSTSYFTNEYITLADVQNDTRTVIEDGGSLLANTWYNITFNVESGTYKIYINGVKKTENTRGGGVQQLTTPNLIQLGAFVRGSILSGPFPGKIASTQLYNRSLSAAEVTQNYNATKSRFGL
jgi:hypothetical protein